MCGGRAPAGVRGRRGAIPPAGTGVGRTTIHANAPGSSARFERSLAKDPAPPALAAYWSAVYPSAVGQEPAITAALHLGVRNGVERVAAVDLRLGSMPRLELDASATRIFVFTENRRLLAASSQPGFTAGDWRLKTPTEVDWPLPRDALEQVVAKRSSTPVRFRSATVTYWGDSRRLNLGRHRSLVLLAVVPESELLGNLPQARVWLACLMLAVLALALLRAVALARRYSEPIEALVVQSDRISRGELDAAEPVPATITEVSKLAQAHERMRTSLKALIRLEDDLQLARRIQQSTFPSELPSATGFDIAAWSEPADQTGGDTYDVVGFRRATAGGREARLSMRRPDHLMLLLADATGHGIGPALSATQIRAMLRMAIRSGEDMPNIARHINDQLCDDLFGGRFITAWLGRLDISKRTLTSFSAGQAPLLHFRAATRDVGVIAADTAPFGVLRELEIHIAPPLPLESGDIFAVLSDGIIDATGAGGERFGVARACAILTEHHADSAEELLMKLRHTLDAFTGTRSPDDDCTALLLKRTAR